jgi:hypothetical protein
VPWFTLRFCFINIEILWSKYEPQFTVFCYFLPFPIPSTPFGGVDGSQLAHSGPRLLLLLGRRGLHDMGLHGSPAHVVGIEHVPGLHQLLLAGRGDRDNGTGRYRDLQQMHVV